MYTTTIAPNRTAAEVGQRLGQHGAAAVMTEYEAGRPRGVSFRIVTARGEHAFRLPVDVAAMERHLARLADSGDIPRKHGKADQAERTAWRVLLSWLNAQLTMIEAGQTKMEQTFLPYMIVGEDGRTVFERFEASGLRELQSGPDAAVAR